MIKLVTRTNRTADCVACITSLEDEHSVVAVFGETRSQHEPRRSSTHYHKVVRVVNLAIADDVPSLSVVTSIGMAARVAGCIRR